MEVDWQSYELAEELLKAFSDHTEGPPAFVALRLGRSKLDANRARGPGSRGSGEDARRAWDAYHGWLEEAARVCVDRFGFCLILDIHGQSHRKGVTELGYLLTRDDLAQPDAALREPPRPTSLDALFRPSYGSSNGGSLVAAEGLAPLVRGPNSLGGLLSARGFPCTPSPDIPSPVTASEPTYFHGGFTARRYGAPDTVPAGSNPLSGAARQTWAQHVAAVQVETSWVGVRDDTTAKEKFAQALRESVDMFLKMSRGWPVQSSVSN